MSTDKLIQKWFRETLSPSNPRLGRTALSFWSWDKSEDPALSPMIASSAHTASMSATKGELRDWAEVSGVAYADCPYGPAFILMLDGPDQEMAVKMRWG